jgi:hypothetical protein
MRRPIRLAAASAALLCPALAPTIASAESSPPAAQAPSAPAPPSAVAGRLALVVQKAFGSPAFALVGRRTVVRGIVSPYVGGQRVQVSFYSRQLPIMRDNVADYLSFCSVNAATLTDDNSCLLLVALNRCVFPRIIGL